MKFCSNFLLSFVAVLAIVGCDFKSQTAKPALEAKPLFGEVFKLNGGEATRVTLPNGLKVILVSSPASTLAAASVAVQAGSNQDPVEAKGMAHFLEHMLFKGTDEFPGSGEFKEFIQSNGGGMNAETKDVATSYYLQINSKKFDEALHRFSRFFVSPLLNPTETEKEKNAIQNEFSISFAKDRMVRPMFAFTSARDAAQIFRVGNRDTLKSVTAGDARKFFDEYYYAESMQVVLAGPQSLGDLKALAEKYFSDVKSDKTKLPIEISDITQFNLASLPARVDKYSQSGAMLLDITIPVSFSKKENPKLLEILGSLIGDESEDSLLYQLQIQGLARSGPGNIMAIVESGHLRIICGLTGKGSAEVNAVVDALLGYIDFLKKNDLPDFLNDERARRHEAEVQNKDFYEVTGEMVGKINFNYMLQYPKKDWRESLVTSANPAADNLEYQDYLGRLNVSKILVQFSHPDNKVAEVQITPYENLETGGMSLRTLGDQKVVVDSIYQTASYVQDVNPAQFKPQGSYTMKKANPYIPISNGNSIAGNPEQYVKIVGDWGQIYLTPMSTPHLSKSFLSLELSSANIDYNSPADNLMLSLFMAMLQNQAANRAFNIIDAGFKFEIDINIEKAALKLDFEGWTETYVQAFGDLFRTTSLQITQADLDNYLQNYLYVAQIMESRDNIGLSKQLVGAAISPAKLRFSDAVAAAESVDVVQFNDFTKRFVSGLHLNGVLTGNVSQQTIDSIVNSIQSSWKPQWAPQEKWVELAHRKTYLEPSAPTDPLPIIESQVEGPIETLSVYAGFWNFGKPQVVQERMARRLLGSWIGTDFYQVLRNEKQFAYGLSASDDIAGDNSGVSFFLASSTLSANEIQTEVDGFFETWALETLPAKSQGQWESAVESIKSRKILSKSPEMLHQKYSALFGVGFDSVEEFYAEIDTVDTMTLADVTAYAQAHLSAKQKKGAFIKVDKKPVTN